METTKRHPEEIRERAVRMVAEQQAEPYPTDDPEKKASPVPTTKAERR